MELQRGKYKHGLSRHELFNCWCSMRYRCNNKNTTGYKNWGGRGISFCKRWGKFENFILDMHNDYLNHKKKFGKRDTLLDRIDNNKNYCPKNCRWVTRIEQNSNTRKNVFIEFNGKKKTMSQWARDIGVDRTTIYYRVFKAKWSLERALKIN